MSDDALLRNILRFGRILHGLGIDVNPGRMIDLINALEHVGLRRRDDVYFTMRTVLVHRREHLALFDQAFDYFWRRHADGSVALDLNDLLAGPVPKEPEPPAVVPAGVEREGGDSAENPDDPEREILELTTTYSARERLAAKDFGEMTADELAAVRRLISELVWELGRRRTRRLTPGPGAVLDLRRSLRRNLHYGNEFVEIARRERKVKPRPVVIIADISGSMERYTRLLLHFVYSVAEGLSQRVEAFVFSTRLTRITRGLRHRSVDHALDDVAAQVPDWAGGTRMGAALKTFNHEWGRRVLRGGAVVLIISDGWDRGDPALLGRQMERLSKTCHRLVWLNPLLGSEQYEPLTRGIMAALPHVDDFLPVHNLASLDQLARHLQQLDDRRRQRARLDGAAFIRR